MILIVLVDCSYCTAVKAVRCRQNVFQGKIKCLGPKLRRKAEKEAKIMVSAECKLIF